MHIAIPILLCAALSGALAGGPPPLPPYSPTPDAWVAQGGDAGLAGYLSTNSIPVPREVEEIPGYRPGMPWGMRFTSQETNFFLVFIHRAPPGWSYVPDRPNPVFRVRAWSRISDRPMELEIYSPEAAQFFRVESELSTEGSAVR